MRRAPAAPVTMHVGCQPPCRCPAGCGGEAACPGRPGLRRGARPEGASADVASRAPLGLRHSWRAAMILRAIHVQGWKCFADPIGRSLRRRPERPARRTPRGSPPSSGDAPRSAGRASVTGRESRRCALGPGAGPDGHGRVQPRGVEYRLPSVSWIGRRRILLARKAGGLSAWPRGMRQTSGRGKS
jgi:hypothetical protein